MADEKQGMSIAERVAARFLSASERLASLGQKFEAKYGITKRFLYKGVNETRKEIYYGVSLGPTARIVDFHAEGKTKALEHWDFANGKDDIKWTIAGQFDDQESASKEAHRLEKVPVSGYKVIETSGI